MSRSTSKVAKRTPSPLSSASSSSVSSGLVHSRSLPSPWRPAAPATSSDSGSISTEAQRRGFRRAASDRIDIRRSAPEAVTMDVEQTEELARKGGQRRRKSPSEERAASKSPRRSRQRRDLPSSREDIVSPTRSRRNLPASDARRPRAANPEAVLADQADGCREDQALPSIPLTMVKSEPEEVEATAPVQAKTASRQFRQRAAGIFASLPSSCFGTSDVGSGSPPPQASPSPPPQRLRRGRVIAPEPCDWSQHIMDIIMWRDFSKSSLIFGAGVFAILSSFFMQDMHFNIVTLASYMALVHLSFVFVRKNIMQRGGVPYTWKVNEATAIELTREALPAVNAALLRLSSLFSGDPSITLKVAGVLWFLTQAGHCLSIWNFLSLAFVGAFVIPKCYSTYSRQLQTQGNYLLSCLLSTWDSCSHKKAVVLMLLIGFWNLSSVSAKLWMAFLFVVALRRSQMGLSAVAEPISPSLVRVKKEF